MLYAYTVFAILYLLLPVVVMALFSFNDPPGKSNVAWHGFTLDAWLHPFAVPGLFDVVRTSVVIAFLSTLVATIARDVDRARAGSLQLPRLGHRRTR